MICKYRIGQARILYMYIRSGRSWELNFHLSQNRRDRNNLKCEIWAYWTFFMVKTQTNDLCLCGWTKPTYTCCKLHMDLQDNNTHHMSHCEASLDQWKRDKTALTLADKPGRPLMVRAMVRGFYMVNELSQVCWWLINVQGPLKVHQEGWHQKYCDRKKSTARQVL